MWTYQAHKQNKQKETTPNRHKTLFPSQALSPSHSWTPHRRTVPCLERYFLSHGTTLMLNYIELWLWLLDHIRKDVLLAFREALSLNFLIGNIENHDKVARRN